MPFLIIESREVRRTDPALPEVPEAKGHWQPGPLISWLCMQYVPQKSTSPLCKQTVRTVSQQALGQGSLEFAFRSTFCDYIPVYLLCCPRGSHRQGTGSAALSHSSYLAQLHVRSHYP